MTITRSLPALILIGSFAFLCLGCGDQRNAATEESATGSAPDDNEVNTEAATPVKLKEYLVGDWIVVKDSVQSGTTFADASEVRFTEDGKYIRLKGKQRIDMGLYRVNEQHRFLYLEPNGNGDPIEWNASIRNPDEMKLVRKLIDSDATQQFILRRKLN